MSGENLRNLSYKLLQSCTRICRKFLFEPLQKLIKGFCILGIVGKESALTFEYCTHAAS